MSEPALNKPAESFTAAFITGHSVPGCTGLSAQQQEFMRRSAIGGKHWLPCNFPWHRSFPFPERVGLAAAGLANLRHYRYSRTAAFREDHRAAAIRTLGAWRRIILLAGSCGLELLANLDLPEDLLGRLHVFAIGPVARRLPATAAMVTVTGTRDPLPRWFSPPAGTTHRVPCGHMGYLRHPETLRLFDAFCARVLKGRPAGAATAAVND